MNVRAFAVRLVRSPAVQLAAVAAFVYWTLPENSGVKLTDAQLPIRVAAADYESAVWAWEKVHGTPPDRQEREVILDRLVADEALFRRALELGLDHTPITEVRLKQLSELVDGVDEHGTSQDFVTDLKGPDFAKRDPIMRGHLIQTMRLVARKVDVPSADELVSFYSSERNRFERPAMYEVRQVYFSSEERGSGGIADARAALDVLQENPHADLDGLGDRFNAGSRFSMRAASRIRAVLGEQVGAAVEQAELGKWLGPLPSTFGWHLVRVDDSVPARAPELATISSEVVHTYLRDRGAEKLARTLRTLRLRYGVEVESL